MDCIVHGSNPGGGHDFLCQSRAALEPTLSPVQWYQISLLVVKQPGHGIDHKPPSNAKVKERVELYLCAPWTFVACSRMSFTFTFTFFVYYTGCFLIYSRITKIYYRKTVGHIFTKTVQIEGITQKFFPSKLFFIVVHISATRRCECM